MFDVVMGLRDPDAVTWHVTTADVNAPVTRQEQSNVKTNYRLALTLTAGTAVAVTGLRAQVKHPFVSPSISVECRMQPLSRPPHHRGSWRPLVDVTSSAA